MKVFKNPLIAIIIILLFVSVSVLGYFSVSGTDLYKELDYVKYDEVLTKTEDPTIYYYFQDTCHFCQSIKGEMTKLNEAIPEDSKFSIKLVDMKDPQNTAAWYDWAAHEKEYGKNTPATDNPNYISNPSEMKKVEDIKVTGTPTMIYVKDNKVIDYQVGQKVFDLLDNAISDNGINVKLDPSVYGKK